MNKQSLSEKTIKGGIWVFSLRVIDRIFQLIRTIILARILSPTDFGLFAIALLVLSILESISQSGFEEALIQKKGNIRQYLNTTWTINVIIGVVIAIIVFFSSDSIASFFNTQVAGNIIRVISLAILLQSFTNVSVLYFKKQLRFYKYFQYNFLGTIADVAVAISLAYILKSAWALIFGLIAGNLVRFIMSFVIESYRPKFQIDISKAKELFKFSKWILGSSILVFLIGHGDDIFVGKLLGVTMLGFYQMAYNISNLPATEITQSIVNVAFPAYSKIQDDILRLKKAYLKTLKFIAFLTIPLTCGIIALAPEFVSYILGDKWAPIIPAIQVLAIFGLIRALGGLNGSFLQAVGRPDILTKLQIIKLLIIILTIHPLALWKGIVGVSISVLISSLSITPICFYIIMSKSLKERSIILLKQTFIYIMSGILMMGTLLVINLNELGIFEFIIKIVIGVFLYCVLIFVFDRIFKERSLAIFKEILRLVKKRN